MRTLEFGEPSDLHGIQCAIGTMLCVKVYNELKNIKPDKEKALSKAKEFDFSNWCITLRNFLGKASESMIELDKKEDKYNLKAHEQRLENILNNWEKVIKIIEDEIPGTTEFENILNTIDAPKYIDEIGIDKNIVPTVMKSAKDIRDKYILPKFLWDIGILDEIF